MRGHLIPVSLWTLLAIGLGAVVAVSLVVFAVLFDHASPVVAVKPPTDPPSK